MYTGGTVAGAFLVQRYLWRNVIGRCLFEERPISSWSCRLWCLNRNHHCDVAKYVPFTSSAVEFFISILMVPIFSGITAYDNQRIRQVYAQTGDQAGTGIVFSSHYNYP